MCEQSLYSLSPIINRKRRAFPEGESNLRLDEVHPGDVPFSSTEAEGIPHKYPQQLFL